jgi:uncharacterized membrane protein
MNGITVFLHVISAIVWVGGMIAIRIAVHPIMQSIENPAIKLGKTIEIIGRLFNLVIPFIILLLVTAVIMALTLKGSSLYKTVLIKEAIWVVMVINFTFMYTRRHKASKLFVRGDMASAKALIALFPNVLLPINIALGLVALYLGITLRGL